MKIFEVTEPHSALPLSDPTDPAPVPPAEPDAADCCGEGCVRCIHDIHDEKLKRYRQALERWRARQAGRDE